MHSFSQTKPLVRFATVLLGAILTLIVPAPSARGQNPPVQQLRGHIPAAVNRLTSLGREKGTERLNLAIGLPLRNQGELQNLLHEIYDPSSTNYHHYLTPEEFTARFGPTEQDYQAVRRFAEQNGFVVTTTHPNRVVLDVDAAVTDIERTLHLEMRTYRHPLEGRIFHAPSTEPTVDLSVPILHISGLDDYSLPHPNSRLKPAAVEANALPKSGSGPGGAYRGTDFRAAYSVGPLTGFGQSVGLLQFDGYYASDIATYASQAGLPVPTLTNVAIDGGVGTPGSGNSEVSLDIEMVMSMAPGLSRIIVYEAPNPRPFVDLLSRMANDNLAKQLSCSWGGGGTDPTSEQVFQQMALQGQSFFNATGDEDAFTGTIPFPSESTNVTQVGATTLTTAGAGGAYVSETVWNWGQVSAGTYTGSSGGVSTHYFIPPYQTGINMTDNLGSTTMRNVPDVALTGDNVYVFYNNGSPGNFGGTSCAAPLWAGFTALMNQQAAAGGQPPVGFLNPALYAIGKSANYTTAFHDVTVGNNFNGGSPAKFPATTGYDLCTGWGTPSGTNLMNLLTTPVYVPVVISAGFNLLAEGCQPANGVIDSDETVTIDLALQNAGSADTTNLVVTMLATNGAGLPSGPQNYGVLTQDGPSVSRQFTFTALGSCGGSAAVTLQLQDGDANLGTVTINFPLGKLAPFFLENFDSLPTFPAGWTLSGSPPWVITGSQSDSAPNSAFVSGPATVQATALVTPPITLPSGPVSQLSFRHNYNLEANPNSGTAYDAGVLEIKIGSGLWTDIISAGGSFVTGGYNLTVSRSFGNTLHGRRAWSSTSGGFIPTIVNLPASTPGQSVQLRWFLGTDNSTASVGWYVDSVAISNIVCCAGNTPPTISGITNVVTAEDVPAGPIGFIIGDAETAPASLVLSTASSNTNLIDAAHIVFGGSDANRTVTLTPLTNQVGSSTITIGVSDGTASTNISFTFTVNPVNHPAVLQNVPDFVIFEKDTLQFTNDASDPDSPAQVLAYSLSNAPAGASITPYSGIFTWTPTEAQGPNTNVITVIVTDNGSPPMSSAKNFTVVVLESNEPPVLAPISNRAIHLGMTLVITNSATDPDIPANTLTYSLSLGPPDATIGGTSGVFLWTPDKSFANTTNTVTVVVTDYNPAAANAQNLSDVQTFTIFVAPPPTISSALMSNDTLTLTWSALPGQTYRVQYNTNLGATNWTDLPPDITATDTTATQSDSNLSDAQRFYRVMVLP